MPSLPAPVHRLALLMFRRMPRKVQRRIVIAVSPRYTLGALVVVRNDAGDLLLVRQSYTRGWSLPGGLLGRHEPPVHAAARELAEETGLRIAPEGLAPAQPNALPQARYHWIDFIYLARLGDTEGELRRDGTEIAELGWFPPGALPPLSRSTGYILRSVGALE